MSNYKLVRFFPKGDGYNATVITTDDDYETLADIRGKEEMIFDEDDTTFYVLEIKHRVTGEKELTYWNNIYTIQEEYDFPEELYETGKYSDDEDGWDVRLIEINQL